MDFVDTGGRLKNYSTGFYCPENFEGEIIVAGSSGDLTL